MSLKNLYLGAIALGGLSMIDDSREANKRKIQEAVDKYWDACKYPRKKKKKMRKEAQRDYNFWVSIETKAL